MSLLVIGATGTLGRQIVRKALEDGFQVVCLVRNKKKANFLLEWGAKLTYGDLSVPETLPKCFRGVSAIIDASTTRPDENLSLNNIDWIGKLTLIELAKATGVKRFIFFSILNSEKYSYIHLMKLKAQVEEKLKSSGVPFTIFRLAGFYQGLIGQYAIPILEKQPIWLTSESVPISYIDTEDVANFCLRCLVLKKTENQVFFLGGPKAWVSEEIVNLCEKLSGQSAQLSLIPINLLKFISKITNLFEWTTSINDRLSFIKVLEEKDNFSACNNELYEIFKIDENDLSRLEDYFQEYFERILKTLKNLSYDQNLKRRDLTF
jgi:uncharacterized protein YbjT (DUF2867 family)|uniref:Ycf39 n=1 Tax=Fibrocapsa japonica TaxID=94617 RepID=UPI0021159E09|nr:Ycf39 [Fibrocapsa japonica]UTE95255.1 Ycf39 [Fibrocapsa japonica]